MRNFHRVGIFVKTQTLLGKCEYLLGANSLEIPDRLLFVLGRRVNALHRHQNVRMPNGAVVYKYGRIMGVLLQNPAFSAFKATRLEGDRVAGRNREGVCPGFAKARQLAKTNSRKLLLERLKAKSASQPFAQLQPLSAGIPRAPSFAIPRGLLSRGAATETGGNHA
jgi:hypothetical protein